MATKATVKQAEATQSKEDLVRNCQKQLKAAGKYYEKNFIKRADRMVHLYELEHYYEQTVQKGQKASYDRIKVPYPYSNARQILAEIFAGLPDPIVNLETKGKPVVPENPQELQPGTKPPPAHDPTNGAQMLRQSIQYVARRSNLEREYKMNLLDGIATGIGCIGISAQASTKIPKFTRYLYRDIEADWSNVTDIYESDWIACKLVRPLQDIKDDPQYDETYRSQVNGAKLDPTEYGDSDLQYGVLWCWHNKKTDQYLVFPDDQPFMLVEKKLSEMYNFKVTSDDYVVDWPFTFFVDEEMILKPWGLGDLYPIESQVRELDKTRTQMMNHRKRFNRKYMYKDGFMDDQAMNQFKNPEDGTSIKVKQDIIPSNFQVVQDAPMSTDVYNTGKIIQDDIQIISPLSADSLSKGTTNSQANTLGQAQIQEQSANTRLADKQRQAAKQLARVYKMIAQYIQQYWKEEDEIRISGDGSDPADWLHFDPSMITAEYSFDVEPESMKDNAPLYRQQYQAAMGVVLPNLRLASISPAVAILLRKYLQTFDTLKNDIDNIIPVDYAYPTVENQGSLTPIPTERISLQVAAKDFPVGVQMKMLTQLGVQTTVQDFMPIPGTIEQNTLVPPPLDPNLPSPDPTQVPGQQAKPVPNPQAVDPHLAALVQGHDPAELNAAMQQLDPASREKIMAHLHQNT